MVNEIENDIFLIAQDAFKNNLATQVEIAIQDDEYTNENSKCDKVLKITVNNIEMLYCTEIKIIVNKATIGLLQHQKGYLPYQQILITKHINPDVAEKLKKAGIQFFDTAGNMYINNFPVYIYVTGNKPNSAITNKMPGNAFHPADLKMIYVLLCTPDLINKPYREIAAHANIALGTVGEVFRKLTALGFLLDMGNRGRKLLKKKGLFDKWCTMYVERLKQKLLFERFSGPENWWQKYTINPVNAQWGGEVAAYMITKYLKPQDITLYINQTEYKNVIIKNKLRKDNAGDIYFFKRFWGTITDYETKNTVHPILIYADLIGTANQRNVETAKVLYEKYIDRYIRES